MSQPPSDGGPVQPRLAGPVAATIAIRHSRRGADVSACHPPGAPTRVDSNPVPQPRHSHKALLGDGDDEIGQV
jgi:hypothetical protein